MGPHQGAGHGVRAEEHHGQRNLARPDRARRRGEDASAQARAQTVARVPLGRMGKPVEVAAAARLLVSEAGAYINGQMIQVNGGAET